MQGDGFRPTSANPVLRDITRSELARVRWHDKAPRRQAVDVVKAVRVAFVARGERFGDYEFLISIPQPQRGFSKRRVRVWSISGGAGRP